MSELDDARQKADELLEKGEKVASGETDASYEELFEEFRYLYNQGYEPEKDIDSYDVFEDELNSALADFEFRMLEGGHPEGTEVDPE